MKIRIGPDQIFKGFARLATSISGTVLMLATLLAVTRHESTGAGSHLDFTLHSNGKP